MGLTKKCGGVPANPTARKTLERLQAGTHPATHDEGWLPEVAICMRQIKPNSWREASVECTSTKVSKGSFEDLEVGRAVTESRERQETLGEERGGTLEDSAHSH